MSTSSDSAPDLSELDWSKAEVGRYARAPGEQTEIRIDGVVGYTLRLIPSNKILARFTSTLDAWPAIIAAVDGGRSPRTLALDWTDAKGRTGKMAAGSFLLAFARLNNGEPHPYPGRARRVAEVRDKVDCSA